MGQPPRLWETAALTATLLLLIAFIAPHQLGVMVYKLALVTFAGVAGYWLDRALFPYARPHLFAWREHDPDTVKTRRAVLTSAAWMRRAVIVAAAMVAIAMGL